MSLAAEFAARVSTKSSCSFLRVSVASATWANNWKRERNGCSNKCRCPIENPGNPGENAIWGSRESVGSFLLNIMKRIAGTLHRIILLHFGLITFRLQYGGDRKPLICMISGFLDASMTPKTNMIYLWRHLETSNISKKENVVGESYSWKYQDYGNSLERWGRESRRPVQLFFDTIDYGINIFQKTWNGFFGNMGSLKFWNFETLKPRNFETKKLWNEEAKNPRTKKPRKPLPLNIPISLGEPQNRLNNDEQRMYML